MFFSVSFRSISVIFEIYSETLFVNIQCDLCLSIVFFYKCQCISLGKNIYPPYKKN